MTPFFWLKRFLWLAVSVIAICIIPAPVQALSFDIPNANTGALINAINTANFTPEADTINLAANGIYVLVAPDNGINGLPIISSEITINGNGAIIARSTVGGTPNFRLLQIVSGGILTLNQVGIYHGKVVGSDGANAADQPPAQPGQNGLPGGSGDQPFSISAGGIFNQGTLIINRSTFFNNQAIGGKGGNGGKGGSGGPETINGTSVDDAGDGGKGGSGGGGGSASGGAIFNAGTLTVNNSTFRANQVIAGQAGKGGNGGNGGNGNVQADGAGGNGGRGGFAFGARGGAVFTNLGSNATFNNVTVVENSVTGLPGGNPGNGGAGNPPGQAGDIGQTILDSEGGGITSDFGTFKVVNTLIALNTATHGGPNCKGSFNPTSHNFIESNAGCSGFANGVNGNIVGSAAAPLDPLLKPPVGNPLFTYSLDSASLAVDAGNNATCAVTDQIGTTRPLIGRDGSTVTCDMGAIENLTPAPNAPAFTQIQAHVFDVDLVWIDNSTIEENYRVERSTDGQNWEIVATLPANTESHNDPGVNCDTLYHYRIFAHNAAGDTPGNILTPVSTLACPTATPTSTATDTPTETATPTSTDTPTETPTASDTPTPTATGSATLTATPTLDITEITATATGEDVTLTPTVTDAATLEVTLTATSSVTPDEVNLLLNGDFEIAGATEKEAADWKAKPIPGLRRFCKPGGAHSGECAYQFKGTGAIKQVIASQAVAGGDLVVLSLWAQGKALSTTGSAKIKIRYADSTKDVLQVLLPSGTYSYQGFSGQKLLAGAVEKFKITIKLSPGSGKLRVDTVKLIRNENAILPLPTAS